MKRLVMLFLLSVVPLAAQTDRATVTGTVMDPSGRRVTSAAVSLTSNSTGLIRETRTNDSGVYTVTSLNTGSYSVRIEAPGFAAFVADTVTLDVGQTRTLDAKLSIAGTTTQIEVVAFKELR